MKYWSIFVPSAIPVQPNTQVTGIRWNPPGQYAVNIPEVSLVDNISLCLVIMWPCLGTNIGTRKRCHNVCLPILTYLSDLNFSLCCLYIVHSLPLINLVYYMLNLIILKFTCVVLHVYIIRLTCCFRLQFLYWPFCCSLHV